MRVIFTGGGTGGHLYPAIAIADALALSAKIGFIGSADRLEASLVPQAGYELMTIASRPLSRQVPWDAARTIASNALGITQALALLRRFAPDIVVATGGYVCFPVIVAARMLRSSAMLHARLALLEPNALPGLANRLLGPIVDEVWGAFEDAAVSFKGKFVLTGMPVRGSLRRPNNRIEAARRLGVRTGRRTILAIGGSQGARSINTSVAALITRRALPADWQILHVSGEADYEYMRAEEAQPFGDNVVTLAPYLANIADAYAVSDLVIARSGASTLGELAALGLPSILVPYPYASEDHQTRNARAFADRGAAEIIADRELDADSLWWRLRSVMEPARLEAMRAAARSLGGTDAVGAIMARIDALVGRKSAA